MIGIGARFAAAAALVCGVSTVPATAQVPAELEQLEPGPGKVQFESQSVFGTGSGGERGTQSFGIAHGLTDRLVIGAEVEGERRGIGVGIDEFQLSALYRLAPADSAVELAVRLAAAMTSSGRFDGTELRLLADYRGEHWLIQGNVMLRRARADEDDASGFSTRLAGVANISRDVGRGIALGLEGSGGFGLVSQRRGERGGWFLGPAATIEFEPQGREVELGIVGSARIAGAGPETSLRVFVQLGL